MSCPLNKTKLESELSKIYGSLSIEDFSKKLIYHKENNEVYLCTLKCSGDKEIKIIAKSYIDDNRLEENVLKLFNNLYDEEDVPTPKIIYYDKEKNVLVREYIPGYTFTEKMNIFMKISNQLNEELSDGSKKKIENIAKIVSKNRYNYLEAAIVTLANIHHKLSKKKTKLITNEGVVPITDNFYIKDFMEDIALLFKKRRVRLSEEDEQEIKGVFKDSVLFEYLQEEIKKDSGFIIGDFYSDNILLKNGNGDDFEKKVKSEEIKLNSILPDIKILDLEKAKIGPIKSDLADFLYDPTFSLKENQIQDLAKSYVEERKRLAGKDVYEWGLEFMKSLSKMSILRSLRGAVNVTSDEEMNAYFRYFKENLEKDSNLTKLYASIINNLHHGKSKLTTLVI